MKTKNQAGSRNGKLATSTEAEVSIPRAFPGRPKYDRNDLETAARIQENGKSVATPDTAAVKRLINEDLMDRMTSKSELTNRPVVELLNDAMQEYLDNCAKAATEQTPFPCFHEMFLGSEYRPDWGMIIKQTLGPDLETSLPLDFEITIPINITLLSSQWLAIASNCPLYNRTLDEAVNIHLHQADCYKPDGFDKDGE